MVLQSDTLEGLWNNYSLLVVVREWNTLKNLESAESGGTFGVFLGKHASCGLPEHTGW